MFDVHVIDREVTSVGTWYFVDILEKRSVKCPHCTAAYEKTILAAKAKIFKVHATGQETLHSIERYSLQSTQGVEKCFKCLIGTASFKVSF